MLINPDIVICPGCAKVWDNLEKFKQDAKDGECPECAYENGIEPYRLLTIEELAKDESDKFNDVALGKFLKTILILVQIHMGNAKVTIPSDFEMQVKSAGWWNRGEMGG